MLRQYYRFILIAALTFSSFYAQASINELLDNSSQKSNNFLTVDKAFSITGRLIDNYAYLDFKITPDYYLYKERFKFLSTSTVQTIGEPTYPKGQSQFDPNFNRIVEIFPQNISIKIPVKTSGDIPEIDVHFQGCAAAGLCYPPHKTSVLLIRDNSITADVTSSGVETKEFTTSDEDYFSNQLQESGLLLSILIFFLAGIALSFTPCVLPMIPIMSSLILGTKNLSQSKTIGLTITYILTMSITFAIAGTLTGFFGAQLNLQAKLQSPWLLFPISLLFIILALSMFGLFHLQLPAFIRDKLSWPEKKRSPLISAILMGILSALVVSPCVSAPLAGTLIYISTTGDALLGGMSLFALGVGMGTPLLAIGLGGQQLLPKAGAWMNSVQQLFGVLLLGVAIWMLDRVIAPQITLALWGTLLIGSAVFLGALNMKKSKGYQALKQTVALVLLTYGICLIIGSAKGNSNPFQPLATLTQTSSTKTSSAVAIDSLAFQHIYTQKALTHALTQAAAEKKAFMIDIYADWCTSCKTMERSLFPSPEIMPLLKGFNLIKFDITKNTAEHIHLLKQHQLFGPPALLFYDSEGNDQPQLKIMGVPSVKLLRERLTLLGKM